MSDSSSAYLRARRTLGGQAIKGLLTGIMYGARIHPFYWGQRGKLHVEKGISYGQTGDANCVLDVYRPKDVEGPLPVVFFVHGGGFRILSKDTHWMMAHEMANQGYMVVTINYRLSPAVRFPEPAQDVCEAFSWLLEHAERLGADLGRLVLMGESAGANLSTMLALVCHLERPEPWAKAIYDKKIRPKVLVPQCGMLEVSNVERYRELKVPTFVADRIVHVSRGYLPVEGDSTDVTLANPLSWIESLPELPKDFPAVFAPVGSKDPIVEDTRRLARALAERSAPVEAPEYPGQGHAFHALFWTAAAKQCWNDTHDFLQRHLS